MTAYVLLAAIALSCSAKSSYPPRPAVIVVKMTEYRFQHPAVLSSGRTVFRVINEGHLKHELVMLKLPDDFPPINVQLHSSVRRPIPTLFFEPARQPGAAGTFAVDLVPGRYAMLCSVHDPGDPDDITHALKGMNSEFRVR